MILSELSHFVFPLSDRGRRESRALTAPVDPARRSTRASHVRKAHGQALQVQPRHPGFPHAMALRLIRALPGERRLLSPLPCQDRPAGIDATVAAPGPHDFAVRCGRFARRANPPDATASIATRTTYRDDRETS